MADIGDPGRIERHYPLGFPDDAPAYPEESPVIEPVHDPVRAPGK
jgi:hypothetical protein